MAIPRHGAHLLVVDDDPRIRKMLTRYFEEEGYAVSSASDGIEMRVYLRHQNFDAILLDLVLPGDSDGFDLAGEICAQSDVPIIMLTCSDDYMTKPFHLREVHAFEVDPASAAIVGTQCRARQRPSHRFRGLEAQSQSPPATRPEGAEVELTTGEFETLTIFVRHTGGVLGRDLLVALTRGRDLSFRSDD